MTLDQILALLKLEASKVEGDWGLRDEFIAEMAQVLSNLSNETRNEIVARAVHDWEQSDFLRAISEVWRENSY